MICCWGCWGNVSDMTASSTARVRCERPGRYARSLASTFASTAHTEWDSGEGRGHLLFTWGHDAEVDMIAGDGILLLHLECAADELVQLEGMIGRGVVDLAQGSDPAEPVEVLWKRPGGQEGTRWTSGLD